MIKDVLIFGAGLIVGWNVLPQPTWVKDGYQLVVAKVKSLLTKSS